jgi:hypothetical protein
VWFYLGDGAVVVAFEACDFRGPLAQHRVLVAEHAEREEPKQEGFKEEQQRQQAKPAAAACLRRVGFCLRVGGGSGLRRVLCGFVEDLRVVRCQRRAAPNPRRSQGTATAAQVRRRRRRWAAVAVVVVVVVVVAAAAGPAVGDQTDEQRGAEGALGTGPKAKEQKVLVVLDAHGVVDPGAKVVELHHAAARDAVVVRADWFVGVAPLAPPPRRTLLRVLSPRAAFFKKMWAKKQNNASARVNE